jgi:hypothetical protein
MPISFGLNASEVVKYSLSRLLPSANLSTLLSTALSYQKVWPLEA